MNRSDVDWQGYWVAATTPFAVDGSLDEGAWRSLLGLYADQRVQGLLVNGSSGEWWAQSPAERRRLAELAIEEVGDRMHVVVNCTDYTPSGVIELAEHAVAKGAAGVLAAPPPYAHPTQEEIFAFYDSVTNAVDAPWMVYNWPRGVAVDISTETITRLADLERIVAIKDSTDELKFMATCEAVVDRIRVFGRLIHRRGMAFLLEVGGDGHIDGGGLGAPFAVPYFEAIWRGDIAAARKLGASYEKLVDSLVNSDYSAKFASPVAQIKAAMNLLGQPGGLVRPPLQNLEDQDALAALRTALSGCGLTNPSHA